MKKLILLLLVVLSANVNAQTESKNRAGNSLPNNMFQLEMGESGRFFANVLFKNNAGVDIGDISPTFSLSYHNRILPWLWMGTTISYNQEASVTSMTFTDGRLVDFENFRTMHQLSFAPSIRFSYFDRHNLFMYSGIQFGMRWERDQLYVGGIGRVNYFGMFAQLTLFGFTYGKNFFIGGEIGFGNKGVLNFTTGYRF